MFTFLHYHHPPPPPPIHNMHTPRSVGRVDVFCTYFSHFNLKVVSINLSFVAL